MSPRRSLFVLVMIVLASTDVVAQLEVYPLVAPGAYVQNKRETVLAGWAGFESALVKAPDQGFSAVMRFGAFYVDLKDDIQGMSAFALGKKSFTCDYSPSISVVVGGGIIYEVAEGYDPVDAAFKIEFGWDLYRNLTISVGTDYIPDPVTDDKWFVYGALDLTPLVCR
jgi:hypothetical protein